MIQINLFKVGLGFICFFVILSNILNYVSIATLVWTENANTNPWINCRYPVQIPPLQGNRPDYSRDPCFGTATQVLIGLGTAFNALSMILVLASMLSICLARFRDSYATYVIIGSFVTTLLSLIFNTAGWCYSFSPQAQQLPLILQFAGQNLEQRTSFGFLHGWSFWLMTPSFACSIIASCLFSSILGCTYIVNRRPNQVGHGKTEIVHHQHLAHHQQPPVQLEKRRESKSESISIVF